MNLNKFGQAVVTEQELCDLLYRNPDANLENFLVDDPNSQYNQSIKHFHYETPLLKELSKFTGTVEEFDQRNQSTWYMPDQYKQLDIAKWLLDQCANEEELQRVGKELLLYQARNLFPLLQYLKYLVDTLREHKIVWGVGRGSSVASFVLYLIGVHKINSIKFDLDIEEFLK